MPIISEDLMKQIEAAYEFRGHVTVTLADGKTLEGFVYNRRFAGSKDQDSDFIEIYPKDQEEGRRIPMSELKKLELTGKNYAETYDEFLKRSK